VSKSLGYAYFSNVEAVVEPEPPSPRNRNRVRKCQPATGATVSSMNRVRTGGTPEERPEEHGMIRRNAAPKTKAQVADLGLHSGTWWRGRDLNPRPSGYECAGRPVTRGYAIHQTSRGAYFSPGDAKSVGKMLARSCSVKRTGPDVGARTDEAIAHRHSWASCSTISARAPAAPPTSPPPEPSPPSPSTRSPPPPSPPPASYAAMSSAERPRRLKGSGAAVNPVPATRNAMPESAATLPVLSPVVPRRWPTGAPVDR
jgi:hypothetical protein